MPRHSKQIVSSKPTACAATTDTKRLFEPSRNDTKGFGSLRIQIAGSTISLLSSYYETIQKVWDRFRRFGRLSMLRLCISKLSKHAEQFS